MYCKIHPRKPNRNIKYIIVSKDDIEKYFNISLENAAKKIGISATTLKKTCRFFDINKWPYTRKNTHKKQENNDDNISNDLKWLTGFNITDDPNILEEILKYN